MAEKERQEITLLLRKWGSGDHEALDRLVGLVYPELHAIAAHYMVRERPGHTLYVTARWAAGPP